MEIVSGAGNWKLIVRRDPDGLAVLRAVTCDAHAILPETLLGLPVTVLGDHALAPDSRPVEGEAVRVTGPPTSPEEWDNRGMRSLTLPRTLRRIGNYAFLNCDRLQSLSLTDNIEMWGGSVFMNCRALERFHLTRETAVQGETLAYLCDVLTRELDITVTEADGRTARLLFPEYIETYEENCPAHHFDLHILGAGYPYHHCFEQKQFDFGRYDRLWDDFLRTEHEPSAALHMAWYRLQYPVSLSEAAGERYWSYLRDHAAEALCWRLAERDTEGLSVLLRETAPPPELRAELTALAREQGNTQAVALLLEARRGCARAEKVFEL